jgi:hypothetical protein
MKRRIIKSSELHVWSLSQAFTGSKEGGSVTFQNVTFKQQSNTASSNEFGIHRLKNQDGNTSSQT